MPFRVRLKTFYANSLLDQQSQPGYEPVKTTAGLGSGIWWREVPRETEMNRMDMPSATVEIVTPKGSLGTFLVSAWLDRPQSFTCNDRSYELLLRQERYYLPFSLHLIEFRHDRYPGTDIPKNFSSRVRLQNLENGEDREVRIFMNNPLRYAGETFYQASFDPDDHGSVLQVVHNPSWLTPYLSCVLVATGLLIQFLSHLVPFLKRRMASPEFAMSRLAIVRMSMKTDCAVGNRSALPGKREKSVYEKMDSIYFGRGDGGLGPVRPAPAAGNRFHTREFGKLPVLMNGRFQPFDSVARNSLLQIRTKQTVYETEGGKAQTLSATDWLLEVMMKPEAADDRKVFRIDNNEVTELLKLPDNQKYYSFNQLRPADGRNRKASPPHRTPGFRQTHRFRVAVDETLRGHEPVPAARSQPQTAGHGRFRGGTGRLPEKHSRRASPP